MAAGQDVHLAVLVAPGDLPQRQHLSLVLPLVTGSVISVSARS